MSTIMCRSTFLSLVFVVLSFFNVNAQIDAGIESLLFANEVTKFNNSTENLSLRRFVFDYKIVEKNIYLGGKFKLDTINKSFLDIGIRGDLKDGFATFTKNGEILNNYRGEIKFQLVTKQAITINSETSNFIQNIISLNTQENFIGMSQEQKEYFKQRQAEIVADEISESNLYESLKMSWFTGRINIPVAKTEYNILTDIETGENSVEGYLPFSVNLGYTWFKQTPNNSFTITTLGELKNFNSIEASKLTKYNLQSFNSSNSNLLSGTKTVYDGDFQTYLNTSIGFESIFLLINNKAGISFRLIQNFGKYDSTNWKVGIPFSLNTKSKQPSISFELAYNKIDSDEFIGLNVAFAFANIIKVK